MGHSHVEEKPNVSSNAAMWFGLLIIFLLGAAINFVKVSSHQEGHHTEAHTEHTGTEHHSSENKGASH